MQQAGDAVRQGATEISQKAGQTASEFKGGITAAGATLDAAGKKLTDVASNFLKTVEAMASGISIANQKAEAALRKANAAASESSLALSQLKNATR